MKSICKQRLKQFLLIFAMSLIGTDLISCGPAYPVSSKDVTNPQQATESISDPHPWEIPAKMIGFRVMESSLSRGLSMTPNCLDLRRWLACGRFLDFPMRINSSQIYIERVIFLNNTLNLDSDHSQEVFFVWSDHDLGVSIIGASASHQVFTGGNHLVGSPRAVTVWHDPSDHQWSVKISEIFQNHNLYSNSNITEADTQVITLNLVLNNNNQVQVEVQFRVSIH